MLSKIVSVISVLILLFAGTYPMPSESEVIVEDASLLSSSRNADEINGVNGAKFFIERPKEENLNTVNASQFGLSESSSDNYAPSTLFPLTSAVNMVE